MIKALAAGLIITALLLSSCANSDNDFDDIMPIKEEYVQPADYIWKRGRIIVYRIEDGDATCWVVIGGTGVGIDCIEE